MSDGEQPDDSQKTEESTQKKLDESRRKGQVANSREVNSWVMLLASTIVVATMGPSFMSRLKDHLKLFIENSDQMPELPEGVTTIFREGVLTVGMMLLFPLLILFVAAILGPLLQVGPLFSAESIKPKLSKISPLEGAKRLFSKKSIVEFLKGVSKISVIALVGFILIKPFYGQIDHMIGLPLILVLQELMTLFLRLMTGVLIVMTIIALMDLVFQRHEHYMKMRMTKQEVKDEYKQSEGDPEIKGKLRQLRQQRAQQRMIQNVPQADVVITNPTHYSIALQYDPDTMDAPVCVAKGIDEVALRIREIAKEHDITLYENRPLARALFDTVDVDEIIPTEHYKAVAEIISYVFGLKGRLN